MNTIRDYLESMFRNLPQTPEVIKAKYELNQMMEDKYTELIKEGKSENEAVGTVISEFGNLEELAASLGIDSIYKKNKQAEVKRNRISIDQIDDLFKYKNISLIVKVFGLFLLISSVTPPIIVDGFCWKEVLGPLGLFLKIALGVAALVASRNIKSQYSSMLSLPCSLGRQETEYIESKQNKASVRNTILSSVGILLCILCVVPPIILCDISDVWDEVSAAFMFYFVGIGVGLIVFSKSIRNYYQILLSINSKDDIYADGNMFYSMEKENEYDDVFIQKKSIVVEYYWLTITCIYLSISFLTYSWHITWIIWPVAGVLMPVAKAIERRIQERKFTKMNEKE